MFILFVTNEISVMFIGMLITVTGAVFLILGMVMFWLMMMLLAPLVSSMETIKFPLPTTCTGPECDPNWTPFPNMVFALRGYNIRRGDPMKKSGDVGFKKSDISPI